MPLKDNPEIRRRERERLAKLETKDVAVNRSLAALREVASRSRDSAVQDILDELDEEVGGNSEPITMEGLRAGAWSADQLADRLPELEAALTGKPMTAGEPTAAEIRSWDAEQIAEFGSERAMAIVNSETSR